METATRIETHSIGENRDSNSYLNLGSSESVSEVNSKLHSEEFLRHESNITEEHLQSGDNENSMPQPSSENEENNQSGKSTSDLVSNVSHSQGSKEHLQKNGCNSEDQSPEVSIHSLPSNPSHEMHIQNGRESIGMDSQKGISEEILMKNNGGDSKSENNEDQSAEDPLKSSETNVKSDNTENVKDEKEETLADKNLEFKGNEGAEEPPSDKEPSDEWMDILGSGHLLKKVLKAGIPHTRPNKSDVCVINYTGYLEDGTVVDKAENFKIHLSDNEVIQGIDFALALMEKGEEAEIKVGPRFAYGSLGRKPDIPSGSTLYYKVTLLDVQEEPPISTLSCDERISLGLKKKERGNWWYARDEHSIAINCYRRALEYLDDTDIPEPHNEEDVSKLLEERLKTYNNLGASQMKINAFDAALMSVNNVLAAQPKNVKALFRKAKILKEKGEIQESINIIRQGLSYEPDSPSLQQELSLLLAAQRRANTKQRELYKKMMGTSASQDKENEKKKNSKNNYNALKWVTLISFAVAVIGTIAIKYKA